MYLKIHWLSKVSLLINQKCLVNVSKLKNRKEVGCLKKNSWSRQPVNCLNLFCTMLFRLREIWLKCPFVGSQHSDFKRKILLSIHIQGISTKNWREKSEISVKILAKWRCLKWKILQKSIEFGSNTYLWFHDLFFCVIAICQLKM